MMYDDLFWNIIVWELAQTVSQRKFYNFHMQRNCFVIFIGNYLTYIIVVDDSRLYFGVPIRLEEVISLKKPIKYKMFGNQRHTWRSVCEDMKASRN